MKLLPVMSSLLVLYLLGSCKQDKNNEVHDTGINYVTDTLSVENKVIDSNVAHTKPDTKNFITTFLQQKKNVSDKLKTLTKKQADALYLTYKKQNDSLLTALQGYEANTLDNYYNLFYTNGDKIKIPDSLQNKVNLLTSAGLEFWEIGEGYVEIRTKPDFYKEIFNNKVSEDVNQYIAITARESTELYTADAGLLLPFNQIGERVITWERFISKYPRGILIKEAKENYANYQINYLFGTDNTPTMDYPDTKLPDENKNEFKRFIKKYPESFTSKLANTILEYKGNSYDDLKKKITSDQENYLKKF